MIPKKLNSSQLAFLLSIPRKEAQKKLERAYIKIEKKVIHQDNPIYSVAVETIEKGLNLRLKEALQDIHDNYCTRHATRAWLLNYPSEKLNKSIKTNKPLRKVSLPYTLKSLMSSESITEVKTLWDKYYGEAFAKAEIELLP
jgi:hypothetical protein